MLIMSVFFKVKRQELNCSPDYFTYLMTGLHLPHAVVRWQTHHIDVIILTPEMAGSVGVRAVA